jgi:hypothetical protein
MSMNEAASHNQKPRDPLISLLPGRWKHLIYILQVNSIQFVYENVFFYDLTKKNYHHKTQK